jgi:DNA-binding Lrp family transcriptional regulator
MPDISNEELQKTANIYWASDRHLRKSAEILGISSSTMHNRLDLIHKRGIKPRVRASVGKETKEVKPEVIKVLWFTDAHNQPDMPLDRFLWLAACDEND